MSDSPIEVWVVKDKKRLWSQTIENWEGGAAPQGDTQHLIKIIDEQMEMIKSLQKHIMGQNEALTYLLKEK